MILQLPLPSRTTKAPATQECRALPDGQVQPLNSCRDRHRCLDGRAYQIAGLDPTVPAPTYKEQSIIYAPESWGRMKLAVQKALETGSSYQLELELIRPDGTLRYINAFGGPKYDKDGRITGLQGTVQDITERKQADEKLRQRDSQFTKLCSSVPGMIYQFMKRPDGKYCVPFTTEKIREIFGCSPEDVREDFSQIARANLPEDLEKVVGSIEYSAKHLTDWNCEYRVQIPGKSIRWMYGNAMSEKLDDGSIT